MVSNSVIGLFLSWVWKRSVVGLSFDFVVLNLTKHLSYLIHNASLYFSSDIQKQYYEKYGYGQVGAFREVIHLKFSTNIKDKLILGFYEIYMYSYMRLRVMLLDCRWRLEVVKFWMHVFDFQAEIWLKIKISFMGEPRVVICWLLQFVRHMQFQSSEEDFGLP